MDLAIQYFVRVKVTQHKEDIRQKTGLTRKMQRGQMGWEGVQKPFINMCYIQEVYLVYPHNTVIGTTIPPRHA
jgi:hypothetical protein